jgi:hypothetical protein
VNERYNSCQDFIFTNNEILLPIIINGEKDTLQFDSGMSTYINIISFGDTNGLSKAGKIKATLPNGIENLYMSLDTCSLECAIYKGNACVIEKVIIPSMPIPCLSKSLVRSFIGAYLLPNQVASKVVFFDFENYQICFSDSIDKDLSEYIPLKAKLIGTQITIYLTINGLEEKFHFDTGCQFALFMNRKKTTFRENDILLDGTTALTLAGMIGEDTSILRKEKVFCGENTGFEIEDTHYSLECSKNLMGMSFISQFNWIIDYKNNQVFVKKIYDSINPREKVNKDYPQHVVYIQDNQLKIILRNLSKNPVYPLGAVIKSVKGVSITTENMCEYMVLLNKIEDWNGWDIEVERKE